MSNPMKELNDILIAGEKFAEKLKEATANGEFNISDLLLIPELAPYVAEAAEDVLDINQLKIEDFASEEGFLMAKKAFGIVIGVYTALKQLNLINKVN